MSSTIPGSAALSISAGFYKVIGVEKDIPAAFLCHEETSVSLFRAVSKMRVWPLGFAYQKEESNHLLRLLLRVMVVSELGKGRLDLSGVYNRDE